MANYGLFILKNGRKYLSGAAISGITTARALKMCYRTAYGVSTLKYKLKLAQKAKDAKKVSQIQAKLKAWSSRYKKYTDLAVIETSNIRSIQRNVRDFIGKMNERQRQMDSIMTLEGNKKTQVIELLEMQQNKEQNKITEINNNLLMIAKSLYWNYYYLNVTNTKLNEQYRNIPQIKKERSQRRKESWKHLGIAKLYLMDIKMKLKQDLVQLRMAKDKLYRKIEAYKKKHSTQGAQFTNKKKDAKLVKMEKELDDFNKQKKQIEDDSTKAFFEAKKFAEKLKHNKKFHNYNVMRKATCTKKQHHEFIEKFIPKYTVVLNLKVDLDNAIKEGKDTKIVNKLKNHFLTLRYKAFEIFSDSKACQANITKEYNILNDIDPPKPCENHTKKQCQDKLTAEIKALQLKVNKATAIWNNVPNGKYTDKNVRAMLDLIKYKQQIQNKEWAKEDCIDSKCDKKDPTDDHKKKPEKCMKGYIRVKGVCVRKPKCVPISKKTCVAKYAQKIRDTQDLIHNTIKEIDGLKKDKSKAGQLKKAQLKLNKLRHKTKHLGQKQRKCHDVTCPGTPKVPKIPVKKPCKSHTQKECQNKYEKLVAKTKAKIAVHEQEKKLHETDKVPNKEAAAKLAKDIAKLQAKLKKYMLAFKNCKDKRCPGDKVRTPKDDLVEAYKIKLIAEYKYKKTTEELTEFTSTSVETTIEETTITSVTEVVSVMETTVVETTQEITIVEEQIQTEISNGNTLKVEKLKAKMEKKKAHLEKHKKKLHHAKKNHAKVLAKVAEHKKCASQVIEIVEEITVIETQIEKIKDDPKQLMDLHKQLDEKKKHKKNVEKDKKRAFGHLKKHHKKITRQEKSEKTGKVAYAQVTQIEEIVEIHEEIIETTEVQIVEFEKRGDTVKVEELKKKLDEHKQLHKDAHKKIKHLKRDTHKKKREITHPKITKIHEVAKANVRKLKHLEKKRQHHKKAVKKLASNKHLLKRAQKLKDVAMVKYYSEQVTETTAEVQTITESISTVETTIETITSNVETTTIRSATSTLKAELIPAFHAKMSVEISLRNAHKTSKKADEALAKIKKDPRASKVDIENAETDVKEASKKVIESREARQQIFKHLSKTHKKVMAHKADHDIKKHLKNLSKHMQEKAHAETKLDHHKGVLKKAKKELFKAKKSGDDSMIEHWSSVVSETTVTVEEVTTVVTEYQETIITQIDTVEKSHNEAKSQHVKLKAEDKRQQVNNLKLNVNAAKVKMLAMKMKLAQAKKVHRLRSRRLGKVDPATQAEVKSLEIEVKLHEVQVTHYETQVTVETEELVTVTEEETIEVTGVKNSSIKNSKTIIKQIETTVEECHVEIKQAHFEIEKHKKALEIASKKNDETTKLRIQLSIDKIESKLPKLHDKVNKQQKKAFKHIHKKNKEMVKKHKQNVKNAKKTIQAAKDKHKLLAKQVHKKKEEAKKIIDKDPHAAFIIQQEIDTITVEVTKTETVIEKHTKLIDLSYTTQFSIQSTKWVEYKKTNLAIAESAKHKIETVKTLISKGKRELKALLAKKDKKATATLVKKLKSLKKQKTLVHKKMKKAHAKAEVCHHKAKLMKLKAAVKFAQHKKDQAHAKEKDDMTIEEIKLKIPTVGRRERNYLRWKWINIQKNKKNNDKVKKAMAKKIAKDTSKLNKVKDKVNKKSLADQSGCQKIVGKAHQKASKILNSTKLDLKKLKAKKNTAKNHKSLNSAKKQVLRAMGIKRKMLKTAKKQAKKCSKAHEKTMKVQIKKLKQEKSKHGKSLTKINYDVKKLQAKLNSKLSKADELKYKVELRTKLNEKSRITIEITTIETDIYERLPSVEQTVISSLHQDVFYKANYSLAKQAHLEIVQSTDIIVETSYEITTIETEITTITKGSGSDADKKAKMHKLKAKKAKLHLKVKKAKKVKAKAHAKKKSAQKRNKKMVAQKLKKAKKVHAIAKKAAKKAAKKHVKKIKKVKKHIKKLIKKLEKAPLIKKKNLLKIRLAKAKRAAKKVLKDHKKVTKKTKKHAAKKQIKKIIKPNVTHHKLKKAIKGLKPHRSHQIIKKALDQANKYTATLSETIDTTVEITQETVAEIQHTEVLHSAVIEEIQVVETMIVTAETSKDTKKIAALKQRLEFSKRKMHKHKKAIKHLKKKHAKLAHKTKRLSLHKAKSMKKIAHMSKLKIKAVKGMKKTAIKKKVKAKKELKKQKKALKKAKKALKKASGAAIATFKTKIVEIQTTVETVTESVETYSSEVTTSSLTISTEINDTKQLHKQVKAQIAQFSSGSKDYMAATESQLVSSSTTTSIETTVEETTSVMESVESSTTITSGRLLDEIPGETRKLTISENKRELIATLLGVDLDDNVRKLELNVEN